MITCTVHVCWDVRCYSSCLSSFSPALLAWLYTKTFVRGGRVLAPLDIISSSPGVQVSILTNRQRISAVSKNIGYRMLIVHTIHHDSTSPPKLLHLLILFHTCTSTTSSKLLSVGLPGELHCVFSSDWRLLSFRLLRKWFLISFIWGEAPSVYTSTCQAMLRVFWSPDPLEHA